MKMQALRNGVKSLRSDVSTPCWVETGEAGRIGAAEGISGRVIFADFSSRKPGKIYRKIATPRIEGKRRSLIGKDSLDVLLWCNDLDLRCKAALADRLGISTDDLSITIKTLSKL